MRILRIKSQKMIIKFSISNYKSFKDKKTLSFIPSSITGLEEENIIRTKKLDLLKSVGLYGPNAGGKSNLLDGLIFMRWYIINSSKNTQANEAIDVDPFRLNSSSENEPSFFEVEFLIKNTRYRYGFEANKEEIVTEWLFESLKTKEYPCFLRNKQEIKIWERFKEGKKLEDKTRANALFISVVSQFNGKKASLIVDWFFQLTPVHGLNTSLSNYSSKTIELLLDKDHRNKLKELILKADFAIEDIEFIEMDKEQIRSSLSKDKLAAFNKRYDMMTTIGRVNTSHSKYDAHLNKIGIEIFNLEQEESEGTKKFFNIMGFLYDAITEGKIIVMDELNARFHTFLSMSILQLFNSKKNINGQIVFVSHDTNLMRNTLLRRDQIYFVEKDSYGSSNLYSLVEYKSRKEAPIEKNYLEGKFGGIPMIDALVDNF